MVINAWRLYHKKRPFKEALNGVGAKISPGRWNQKGTPLVYTGSSMALCAFELLVHLDEMQHLRLYNFCSISIDNSHIQEIDHNDLPAKWSDLDASSSRDFGQRWIESGSSLALMVPSIVVPQSTNIIINPAHPDFSSIQVLHKDVPYSLDPRLSPTIYKP